MMVRENDLSMETTDMHNVQDGARTALADAEEAKAAAEIAIQEAAFNAFKQEYNTLKGQYDALAVKDDLGTATAADYGIMEGLEARYHQDKEIYDGFEADRLAKVKDQLEKQYNKAKMAVERARADKVVLDAAVTAQTAANAKATTDEATYRALMTKLTTQLNTMTVAADIEKTQKRLRETSPLLTNA